MCDLGIHKPSYFKKGREARAVSHKPEEAERGKQVLRILCLCPWRPKVLPCICVTGIPAHTGEQPKKESASSMVKLVGVCDQVPRLVKT